MGILNYSHKEVLADLKPHVNVFKSAYQAVTLELQELREKVTSLERKRAVARLKVLYFEALEKGMPFERIRGNADHLLYPLRPEDLEVDDPEIEMICELFNERVI
jgi:hypothetical protein